MSVNTKFEAYKIKRELTRSGTEYEFFREALNEFKEPVAGDVTSIGKIKCIYHEQNSTVQITTGETTQVRTKKLPMLLCLYEEATSLGLLVGDKTTINGKTFKYTGTVNVQEWGIVADISLEVVDDGVHD